VKKNKKLCVAIGSLTSMGVWKGVAMDSLKFHLGLPCPTFLHPMGGPLLKRPYDLLQVASAILYLFGHPTPYAYASLSLSLGGLVPLFDFDEKVRNGST
jgi:hypothetical protein